MVVLPALSRPIMSILQSSLPNRRSKTLVKEDNTLPIVCQPLYSSVLPVIHHDEYACSWPENHRFKMAKFTKLMKYLLKENIVLPKQVVQPFKASYDDLITTHTPHYVQSFINGTIGQNEMRQTGFQWSRGLANRCLVEVGGTILAAKVALHYGLACSTGGGTHHAFPSHGSGFCIFNDLAIAASHLLDYNMVSKVLIVDLDVHQGDGTAFTLQSNHDIFTFSVHCEKNFPVHKQSSDLDVGLESGIEDKEYMDTVRIHLAWLLDRYRPDIVLYDAGVDPHKDDVLGKLNLTDQGLFNRDVEVMRMSLYRGIPCATVIGGGYDDDVDVLAARHAIIFRAATKVWSENIT
ncbi:uncharacterized protein LOC110238106 isoform X2 [Exaiptasia diaphana]|uniref:Histone deacetylase domain-containing protein n=1 Tax=Exaiptasia diaphana TaxID=2652724 RepID=A0A913X6X4_EXADI|nr:uncharacterized protein LOC110238106 isoform X2 [Exaiptasia diaphana]XP_020899413.1 uncharacterized protein LOC110238106 isoform X2 [Exaiptasia diaphana]KXJ14932.1 Uncharacterized protein SYNPCC7002-A1628 [Exaiptasia diaphana]